MSKNSPRKVTKTLFCTISIPTQKPPPTPIQDSNTASITSSENAEPKNQAETQLKTRRRKKRDERPKELYRF